MRTQMEVAWHLMHLDLTFELAAFFLLELAFRGAENNILRALSSLLSEGVSHTLDLAILIKSMLV